MIDVIGWYLGDCWINYIEEDIYNKYQIEDPIFVVNTLQARLSQKAEIEKWISRKTENEGKWIKYKFIKEDVFELKDFFPDPSIKKCMKEAWSWFKCLENTHKSYRVYFETQTHLATKYDVAKGVGWSMLDGHLELSFHQKKDPNPSRSRIVYTWDYTSRFPRYLHKEGWLNLEFE